LTILGYSMYDTIIVFDRVRENIPRMPRAAFSQIVNRSMSEVLTRSIATTSCTLMPIIALLVFGGSAGSTELTDFAFALLVGVASGAYSSIFIASPVLTHWKERETQYRHRRERIESEFGYLPAYATTGADIEPTPRRVRRAGRLTEPSPEGVSAAEFEEMKRDLDLDLDEPARGRRTSTLTKRLAHTESASDAPPPRSQRSPSRRTKPSGGAQVGDGAERAGNGAPRSSPQPSPRPSPQPPPQPEAEAEVERTDEVTPAPDVAENEGVAPTQPKRPAKPRSKNRRHGRRR
jgi:SecD/SecF fusion protein